MFNSFSLLFTSHSKCFSVMEVIPLSPLSSGQIIDPFCGHRYPVLNNTYWVSFTFSHMTHDSKPTQSHPRECVMELCVCVCEWVLVLCVRKYVMVLCVHQLTGPLPSSPPLDDRGQLHEALRLHPEAAERDQPPEAGHERRRASQALPHPPPPQLQQESPADGQDLRPTGGGGGGGPGHTSLMTDKHIVKGYDGLYLTLGRRRRPM